MYKLLSNTRICDIAEIGYRLGAVSGWILYGNTLKDTAATMKTLQ